MLDLRPATARLSRLHEGFLDETLPPALHSAAFDAYVPDAHAPALVERGRQAWTLRTLDEYRSMAAFSELHANLVRLGCAADLLGTGLRVVRDEDRHVAVCARLVGALGGTAVLDGEPRYTRVPDALPLKLKVLYTVVGSLCIGETYSMHVLAEMQKWTDDPLAHEVVRLLAKDEAVHAAFGWQVLEVFAPWLDDEERATVQRWIAPNLEACARAMRPSSITLDGPAHPFGSIDAATRRRVYDTATARIADKLHAVGFDPAFDTTQAATP